MYQTTIRHLFVTAAFLTFSMSAGSGEQRGVTDGEIRIGQTMPYSGALSAYSVLGKAEIAYFNLVNERGGINGRKIKLISVDDGYVPPRTVEQTRRLTTICRSSKCSSCASTANNGSVSARSSRRTDASADAEPIRMTPLELAWLIEC
jgi:branched-chain amino acid transport system substrate-binding protein